MTASPKTLTPRRIVLWLLLIFLLAIAVRVPAFFLPMGSEAGRVAYVGRRWAAGAVPYRDVWDRDPPGIYVIAGTIVRFLIPSARRCRVVMVAFDLGTLALLIALARRWCTWPETLVAAGLCAVFGGAAHVQGDCLTAGPPTALLLTAAVYAASRGGAGRGIWFLAAGLAGGLAVTVRPTAGAVVAALVLWALRVGRGERPFGVRAGRAGLVLVGGLLPAAAFVAWFAVQGQDALAALWDSVFVYNAHYRWLPNFAVTWQPNMTLLRGLAPEQGALWLFAAGWVTHAFSVGVRRETGLIALWLLASLAVLGVGQRLEAIDFLIAVPPMAIAAGLAVTNPSEPFLQRDERGRLRASSQMLVLFAAVLVGGFLYAQARAHASEEARERIRADRAAADVAFLLKRRTNPFTSIYVWGDKPQIYVLADRPAAHRIFFRRPLNSPRAFEDYFGKGIVDDIFTTLREKQIPFFITTETAVLEDAQVSEFLKSGYKPWGDPDTPPSEWTIIFARDDRGGDPDDADE
ncbi:hypothetical protein HQ560_13010 [bacterium]|nr:hypothetical protein [bacterium]